MNRKERGHAEKLVAKLVADGQVELVEGADVPAIVEKVGDQLVWWADEIHGIGNRGYSLGEMLSVMSDVAEVFATDDELQAAIDGWRLAVRGPEIVVTDARDREIEARLAAEDDVELAAVYADWLIERGNPLGELFACATDDKARKRVLAKHGALLWGGVTEYVKLFDFTWSKAGIAGISVERTTAYELEWGRVIGALLERPLAAFCRSLSIGPLPSEASTQFDDMLDIIASTQRPTLRHLAVYCPGRDVELGDLTSGYPNVSSLEVESFDLRKVLAHPKLERLRLLLHSTEAIETAMARAELPRLRALALGQRYPTAGHVLGKLVDMPWFNQLEELDVSGLGMTRQQIVEHYGRRVSHLRIS